MAFAAQDTIENIIAGIFIMVDRPFREGDRILLPKKIGSLYSSWGDVTEIGLRTTRVRSTDGVLLTIPNKNLTKVKVKGPTYSIPVACATKAVPHITDASKSRRLPLKVSNFYNLFNFIAFSLLIHQVSITIPYSGILSG